MFLFAAALSAQTAEKGAPPASPRVSLLNPALLKEQAPDAYRARFTTTKGDFVVEVKRAWAPRGADRFYNLVKNGFYDNAGIFRVLPGFVAQFGISPRPEVARIWSQATIPDDPVKQSNLRGFLTFATAGPNTRTTQVFINLANNPRLDAMGFAPFAKVVEGMDVVERLYSGYGEGPDQGRLTNEGKAYLDKNFPRLDIIKSSVIEPLAAPPKSGTAQKETK
ncbi:MAG: peptidylprolyl isomerase [Acidobacteriia bacterium]|nr:peptidylprolyl isomerase [Terriglobia bacterium]